MTNNELKQMDEALPPATMPAAAEADPQTAALSAGVPPGEEEETEWEDEEPEALSEKDVWPREAAPEHVIAWKGEENLRKSAPASPAPYGRVLAESASGRKVQENASAQPTKFPAAAPASRGTAGGTEEARRRYWQGVLTGSADTVPDAVRRRAGVDEAGLSEEQRDYRLLSSINRSWAVDHLGVSREQVRSGWANLRAQLAERFRVADDEQELFAALSMEAQDAPRREAVEALYEGHYTAALLGKASPAPEAAAPGTQLPVARELANAARRRGESMRRRLLPLARELAEGLEAFEAMEEDAVAAPRVLTSLPELASSVEALVGMPERGRQLVYALAQAELRSREAKRVPGKEGLLRTVQRSVRRGATQLGYAAGQALAHAGAASLESLGTALGEGAGAPLREGAAGVDARARIVDEVRRVLHEDVKPLVVSEEAGFAGQLLVDAAGAVPAAMMACSGGAGFAALGMSGVGQSVAEARRRAPEGSQQLQYLAGVVAGGIQASIYAGMGRVGGQLLSNAIGRFARAAGKGAQAYVLPSLEVGAAMGVEQAKLMAAGKAAEAAGLGAQELAARAERTASNIDWREYGDNAQDLELNLREAAMNLPFILIASGRVALRHFRSRRAVLGEGNALLDWGIDEGTRDAIMKESNIDRQGEMLRDALRGSRRWSAPGFLAEAARALRLLNSDYYQGFKETQTVADFLQLPSESGRVPRPPFRAVSPENPEQVQELMERHGVPEKANRSRLATALALWDEWMQKANLVRPAGAEGEGRVANETMLPTSQRRTHFGLELLHLGDVVPPRLRPGGFYAPHAEAERMAMLRDRVAELHDLSYQMLLSAFTVDSLSHTPRSLEHMRSAAESARQRLLACVGRAVLKRATGVPELEALGELGSELSRYYTKRRYANFPPLWMKSVKGVYTQRLDEYAVATAAQQLPDAAPELLDAYRVALGFRLCTNALYELLPTTPDFQSALSRGLSPAQAYMHLLSRELEVDLTKASGVEKLVASLGSNVTDMKAYRDRMFQAFDAYRRFTGCGLESALSAETGTKHWRVRRANGSYTRWHRQRADAMSDMVSNASFMFMPFSYDRMKPLRELRPGQDYDRNEEVQAKAWQYTGYDQLCRVALRDSAHDWLESSPYALPGFSLQNPRRYVYLGGSRASSGPQLSIEEELGSVRVDSYSLTSPLSLAQARFFSYWWRQLNAGMISAEAAGEELVRMRVMTSEELQQVKDIAKPLLMPRNPNVPLKDTPPPDVPGMNRAMAKHLTNFSMRYFLTHLDEMPLPASAREWYRLAPLCPLQPGELPRKALRLTLHENDDYLTCWANRRAAGELREFAPQMNELRRAEREGLLLNSALLPGVRDAVGLNRALGVEQAWCMKASGTEAFMSTNPRYWQLMQQPLAGWQGLEASEQELLARYLEPISRHAPAPASVEAEARGEMPDAVLDSLHNLQEVLEDYPFLHQYEMSESQGSPKVLRLVVDEPGGPSHPFAEPEYDMLPLYMGGRMKEGFRLEESAELPDNLLDDPRVVPALQLLRALRNYPGSRPFVQHEGIQWQGKLYGGAGGLTPPRLFEHESWDVVQPLEGLVYILRRVDELKSTLPEGELPAFLELELDGLGEGVDLSPLANVTCYRSAKNQTHVVRLMPGEPEVGNAAARLPYITHAFCGTYMGHDTMLTQPADMHLAYMPLESYKPYRPFHARVLLDETRRANSLLGLDYTLSGVLSSTMRMAGQERPQGGIVSMRELLMRFAEDTGFSDSMFLADPTGLSCGQLLTLKLAREMLLCVCGPEPGEAYRRLIRLSHRVRRSTALREAVLHVLSTHVETLFQAGEKLFHRDTHKKWEEKKPKRIQPRTYVTPEEKDRLVDWGARHNYMKKLWHQRDFDDGFNDDVRPDGYSKGFFDD